MPAPAVASNFGVPSLLIRALIWAGVPVMLILGLVRSPFAQSGPGGYGPGPGPGMERMRGGDRLGPPGGENRMHLLEAIEGPLTDGWTYRANGR
jgi:hypothetical protein